MSITITGDLADTFGKVQVNSTDRITMTNSGYTTINSNASLRVPTGTTAQRPASPVAGDTRYNTTNTALELYNGTAWKTVGALDGSTSALAAPNAVYLRDVAGIQTNGTYWITVNGTPTQIYCNFTVAGGGWMSFASAPGSGNWFGGDTGNLTSWVNLSYSFGTYSSAGSIGNYWRNYNGQSVTELLFLTGNGTFWIRFPLTYITAGAPGDGVFTTNVFTSNNFPDNSKAANTTVSILNRTGGGSIGEDPWIIAANEHQSAESATDYTFWGESGTSGHQNFKNANAGIIVFVR